MMNDRRDPLSPVAVVYDAMGSLPREVECGGCAPPVLVTGKITPEYFQQCTGYAPIQDDMERVNCPDAGTPGHWQCGWNERLQQPVFAVGRE